MKKASVSRASSAPSLRKKSPLRKPPIKFPDSLTSMNAAIKAYPNNRAFRATGDIITTALKPAISSAPVSPVKDRNPPYYVKPPQEYFQYRNPNKVITERAGFNRAVLKKQRQNADGMSNKLQHANVMKALRNRIYSGKQSNNYNIIFGQYPNATMEVKVQKKKGGYLVLHYMVPKEVTRVQNLYDYLNLVRRLNPTVYDKR